MNIRRVWGRAAIAAMVCGAFTVEANGHRTHPKGASYFVPCTGKYASCFQSGAEALPCKLMPDGHFASCTCTVQDGLNFVVMTAILNDAVYRATILACGSSGRRCHTKDSAPVCRYLRDGRLIPGADVISDFSQDASDSVNGSAPVTSCEGSFAGCMTAPCTFNDDGTAECSCPVFHGRFKLAGSDQECTLGDDLVPSASYTPALEP